MRKNILHPGAKELTYEIRKIVWVAKVVESYWKELIMENIWDPVAKWESIPDWLKTTVQDSCKYDSTYWYCPTKWLEETREYIASKNPIINKEDIYFFNGLWDAINKIYKNLDENARVIWPNPAYSTHSSAEAAHAWCEHITYKLDPDNEWNPDLLELENKIKYNPNIVGILVVNPDNPTWAVFKKEVLEKIISLAKEYDLFVVFDEIYEKLVYNNNDRVLLSDIIWDVPWISMKWASKDLPWPWARCWRIEVYNKDKDENFSQYVDSILNSKMLEVCSTTLPQKVLPELYSKPEFEEYRLQRIEKYKQRADLAEEILWQCDLIKVVKPKWAFYLSVTFDMSKFSWNETMFIENKELEEYIKLAIWDNNARFDKRFCYYLLASTWICSVPLSWFNSTYEWFRITLLEEDLDKYKYILNTIKTAIENFK